LFYGIKERKEIDITYLTYRRIFSHYSTKSKQDVLPIVKMEWLKGLCELTLENLAVIFLHLDKKKLLKMCPSSEEREALEKLLNDAKSHNLIA